MLVIFSSMPFYTDHVDESPHQIHSYTLLFSLLLYFLYIIDPPLCTLTACDCTHTRFIGPISLIWWTHDLWFTCFTSILSIPNVHPPAVWPITSPRTMQSGTFYSFASDEAYAHFLVYHSYLTCLYFTFHSDHHHRSANQLPIWVSPRIEILHLRLTSPHTYLAPFHTASHCLIIPLSLPFTTPGDNPLPTDHTLRAP